jgi:septal ring factor EnvC (AmiA/AmiB activator)
MWIYVCAFCLCCWQALEKDLEDLKAQVLAAEGLQGELEGTQAQLAAARSQQQQLQQDLEQARGNMSQLEYELHGAL